MAPMHLRVYPRFATKVLALGGDLKSAVCRAEGHDAWLSEAIGDLGKIVVVDSGEDAETGLAVMRSHRYGREAACIGHVVARDAPLVELMTVAGGRRVVQRPYGEELPRIC